MLRMFSGAGASNYSMNRDNKPEELCRNLRISWDIPEW
jgi:hypothetical protein